MFEWMKGNTHSLVVTFNQGNVTLNNCAASYFSNVRYVMIGFDKINKSIGIKPVAKIDIDTKIVQLEQLHKITIGKGYARISNKTISEEVREMTGRPVDGLKLLARFDEKEDMLIININDMA